MIRNAVIAISAAAALAGCTTTGGIFGTGVTATAVVADIKLACGLAADVDQIAKLITASPAVDTAYDIAQVVCSTVSNVTSQPVSSRLGATLSRPITVIVNGVTLNLTPAS